MIMRSFLKAAALIGMMKFLGAKAWCADAAKPNILIIFVDDLGYETVGAYGAKDFETPQIDRMASEGLLFERAYTSPVCTPSRVSLHTSLYTSDHKHTYVLEAHKGSKDKVDFERFPTFAQLFRSHGYATAVTGKWQLATLTEHPDHIRSAGFDSWYVWQIWDGEAKTSRYYKPYYNHDGTVVTGVEDQFGPDLMADYVEETIAAHAKDQSPFLIVHNMVLPHIPLVLTPSDKSAGVTTPSLGSMVSYLDQEVGHLLDSIEELGIRDNTYVFFIGDNGTQSDEARRTENGLVAGGKYDLSDSGTHVPFIVWGPDSTSRGERLNDLVDITDVFPTIAELAGISLPKDLHLRGFSIANQIQGQSATGVERQWVHQGIGESETVFDGSWRLNSDGALFDCRDLPNMLPVIVESPETKAARAKLEAVFSSLHDDAD